MADKRTLILPADKLALMQCVTSMRLSWVATLQALALIHDNKPGPWLDDLECKILNGLKNATTDVASLEREAQIVTPAIQLATDVFTDVREGLANEARNRDDEP